MADISNIEALNNLKKNIVIDDEVFSRNAEQLQELINDVKTLVTNVNDMLLQLSIGYNTPAGRKLLNSCKMHIIVPLVEQELVISQVMKNLEIAKNGYQSVFEEYKQLSDYMAE